MVYSETIDDFEPVFLCLKGKEQDGTMAPSVR